MVYDEGYDVPLINHYAPLFVIEKVLRERGIFTRAVFDPGAKGW